MADVNKLKLQLRSGLSTNGDKTPSPATRLLINHGKPNFTIQRSTKAPNGNIKSTSPTPASSCHIQNNNNDLVVKSTTFKPSNISTVTKQTLPQNGNTVTSNDTDNEATKVVLRRPKIVATEKREEKDDDNVPEFIRRQRRIQERLANQNILDFENRRSGYFTQVLLSPSSPNRQSFAETMASPAVKPGLEIPPPITQHEDIQEETSQKEQENEQQLQQQQQQSDIEESAKTATLNGQAEEEEVAKAIEEVNRAVEGEDDDKADLEDHNNNFQQYDTKQNIESTNLAVTTSEHVEETKSESEESKTAILEMTNTEEITNFNSDEIVKQEQSPQENCNNEAAVTLAPSNGEQIEEHHLQNGHSLSQESTTLNNTITISHTNDLNNPSLPSPDPKGEKGVNFETKTVVSFSQELGNGDNKYPDTVKVLKDVKAPEVDSELKELAKLKFEIKADDQNIEVKPVLINEAP